MMTQTGYNDLVDRIVNRAVTTHEEDANLKPCPFCGGEAVLSWSMTSTPHPFVRCKYGAFEHPKCHGAVAVTYDYRNKSDAIDAWNRRAGCTR